MKMLALDIMEDMAWNDFLAKDGEYAYRLNTKGQVQEGTFQRKANGKNTFLPDDGGTPIFVSERNSMSALTGDRVRVQFLARAPQPYQGGNGDGDPPSQRRTPSPASCAWTATSPSSSHRRRSSSMISSCRRSGSRVARRATAPWCVSRSGLMQSTRTSSERWWTCSGQRATTMWR